MCATQAQTSNRASKTSKRLSQTGHRDSLTHLLAFARGFCFTLPMIEPAGGKGPIEVAVCGGPGGPASGLSVVSGISILCRTHGPITAGMARPDSPQT